MNQFPWILVCSECSHTSDASGLPSVCPQCEAPWLVKYEQHPLPETKADYANRPRSMWRYREWLPLANGEEPVSLGEGMTPLVDAPELARALDLSRVWIKDESLNPTGTFKARGLSAATTRAKAGGAKVLTVPTAGNAGVACSAYGREAGIPVHVFAPRTTPPVILEQIRAHGGELELLDGHIGDCGRAARAFAAENGGFDLSTLREPYRIEGKKTLGLEVLEQLGWSFPDAVIYPTGGGTGLIGMWKVFNELRDAGWVHGKLPRLFSVQSHGCAPVVAAFDSGALSVTPWPDPSTVASGLNVPGPLGGKLMLRYLRASGGSAIAVTDSHLTAGARRIAEATGVDACPEGGAAMAALEELRQSCQIEAHQQVVLFNTGGGWLYR